MLLPSSSKNRSTHTILVLRVVISMPSLAAQPVRPLVSYSSQVNLLVDIHSLSLLEVSNSLLSSLPPPPPLSLSLSHTHTHTPPLSLSIYTILFVCRWSCDNRHTGYRLCTREWPSSSRRKEEKGNYSDYCSFRIANLNPIPLVLHKFVSAL